MDFYVCVGDSVQFSKTVSEADVYLFAGVTGDLAPVHVNAQLMEKSAYGQRIAHGALLVGFMSTCSTLMVARSADSHNKGETPVSLGYDRVRFLAPVFFGDTMNLDYRIAGIDVERRRSTANITVTNQNGVLVASATHILKWVKIKNGADNA
ncbi:MAG: dehydratase [Cereibacter sphaeroides]|uniref:Dehydratase n=1 Tax=Cereibacter sphaeroides TaxID=1063 RepID=A0A2W5SBT6_CERSP|nr:MAG: dehydratase [Cereibacter sphaeroides]